MFAAFVITFVVLLVIGVPVAFVLGMSGLASLLVWQEVSPISIIPQRVFSGMNSFPLMAIPFFILAGELMGKSIMARLVRLSNAVIGHLKGGLAHVNIVASMFFGGITGAGVADTAAIGSMLIPAMEQEGYSKDFSAAVTAASSTIGPIIPPSIPLVIYALSVGNVSIGALFIAGVIPGLLIGLGLMTVVAVFSITRHLPKHTETFRFKEFLISLKGAVWALLMPLIILGGILSGVFTATEAAVVAVVYALFVNFVIYRDMTIQELFERIIHSAVITSVVLFMISMARIVSWIITIQEVPQFLVKNVAAVSSNPEIFLVMVMVLLLGIGCLLESSAAIIMFSPVLAPVADALGVDPIHFGFIVVMNLMIGMITPPVGIILFVASGIAGLKLERLVKAITPFLLTIVLVLFAIVFIPELTLFLPRLFGY